MKTNPFIRTLMVLGVIFGPYLIGIYYPLLTGHPPLGDVITTWAFGMMVMLVMVVCGFIVRLLYKFIMTGDIF